MDSTMAYAMDCCDIYYTVHAEVKCHVDGQVASFVHTSRVPKVLKVHVTYFIV